MPFKTHEQPADILREPNDSSLAEVPEGASIRGRFLKEYSTDKAVRKYSRKTAGTGIEYLLEHDYGEIYRDAIDNFVPPAARQAGLNLLEFGCGAGMNLLYLVASLERQGIKVAHAYGTDFSEPLIAAADKEADAYLPSILRNKVRFCVARNESLVKDLASELGIRQSELQASFHLVLGVNTIRYCHRLGNVNECVQGIFSLLSPGSPCIVIDMNKGFPFFRSRIRDRLKKSSRERYLPSLDGYARPFIDAGFEIIRKSYFSWIPHSASPLLLTMIRTASPLLNRVAATHAMRCLVVSRKPG